MHKTAVNMCLNDWVNWGTEVKARKTTERLTEGERRPFRNKMLLS